MNSEKNITTVLPIRFYGSLTIADVYEAAHLAQPRGNKISTWVIRILLACVFAYMVWLVVYALLKKDEGLARFALAGLLIACLPIVIAVCTTIWHRRRAQKYCREGKFLYTRTEGEINDEYLKTKSDVGEAAMNWPAFCGYRVSENTAVLYLRYPGSYLIFARTKFSNDDDWARFIALITQKLQTV